jgi:hypothetical protein
LNGKARVAAGAKAFANLTIWLTGPLSQGSAAGAPTFRSRRLLLQVPFAGDP